MPPFTLLWKLAALLPAPLAGATFHRMGLSALSAGCFHEADRLFERAARRYRVEIAVEPLARLRAHQGIARVRACAHAAPERLLEVERQLYRLRTIESLDPPHALIDSGRLLASWNPAAASARPRPIRALRASPHNGFRGA